MKFERILKIDFNRKIGNIIKIVKEKRNKNEPKYANEILESRSFNIKFEDKIYQVNITVDVSSSTAPVDYELFED